MTSSRFSRIVLPVLILAGLFCVLHLRDRPLDPTPLPEPEPHDPIPGLTVPPSAVRQIDTTNNDPRFTRFTDGTIHWQASFSLAHQLHSTPDPRNDLHLVAQILSQYRLIFRENPVGTDNAEITAALLGQNPKNVFLLPPDHPALNPAGELLDRWGSPYHFHSLKADLMDIRSPGPDRQLWTTDDLSLDLENHETQLGLPSPDAE